MRCSVISQHGRHLSQALEARRHDLWESSSSTLTMIRQRRRARSVYSSSTTLTAAASATNHHDGYHNSNSLKNKGRDRSSAGPRIRSNVEYNPLVQGDPGEPNPSEYLGARHHRRTDKLNTKNDSSLEYWTKETRSLLRNTESSSSSSSVSVVGAVEAIRFWTTQRTPQAVRTCWQLWDKLTITGQLTLQQTTYYWLTQGNYPQITHLLNAIVDSWRIVWEHRHHHHHPSTAPDFTYVAGATADNDSTVANARSIETPDEMLKRLKAPSMNSYVNNRTFTIWMTALLVTLRQQQQQTTTAMPSRGKKIHRRHHQYDADVRHLQQQRQQAPILCEEVLNHMLDLGYRKNAEAEASENASRKTEMTRNRRNTVLPDTVAFTTVLHAWTKSGRFDAPSRAMELWLEWQQLLQDGLFLHIDDDRHEDYDDYDSSASTNSSRRPRRRSSSSSSSRGSGGRPNVFSYNTLLDALCSSRDRVWLQRAGDIVQGMMKSQETMRNKKYNPSDPLDDDFLLPPPPNLVTFQLLVHGYATMNNKLDKVGGRGKDRRGGGRRRRGADDDDDYCWERAIYWLEQMLEAKLGHADVFSQVIHEAVKAKRYDIAEQVYRLLLLQHKGSPRDKSSSSSSSRSDDSNNGLRDLEPTTMFVSRSMLIVYAKTNRPELAEAELVRLEKAAGGDSRMFPKRGHYFDVLHAWATSSSSTTDKNTKDAVLSSFSNLIEAAERSERILLRMMDVAQQQHKAERKNVYAKKANVVVWADTRTVDSVLRLWLNAARDFAAVAVAENHRASSTSDSNDVMDRTTSSTSSTGTIALDDADLDNSAGYYRPPEERAEELLQTLRAMRPFVEIGASSYHLVMDAWAWSLRPEAAQRSLALLHELEQGEEGDESTNPDAMLQHQRRQLRPNRYHYTSVMRAWIHGYPQHYDKDTVEQQLEQLVDAALLQVQSGNIAAMPDTTMVSTMLHAYARLGNGRAAERLLELLWKASASPSVAGVPGSIRGGVGGAAAAVVVPTAREVNLALLAWLRSSDPKVALPRALSLVKRMEMQSLRSDDRTKRLLKEIHAASDKQLKEHQQEEVPL